MRQRLAVLSALVALFLPWKTAVAQADTPMPELDVLRAWIAAHHPALSAGDSGLNAVIIVVDTNAKYVRSAAFALSDTAMLTMQGGIELAAAMRHDTAWTHRVEACIRDRSKPPTAKLPVCALDGARVRDIDMFQFFTSGVIAVLKGDAATARFGSEASSGAVLFTTNRVALVRYQELGVKPENFVSFMTRRTRRNVDGAPVVITVLMLRTR